MKKILIGLSAIGTLALGSTAVAEQPTTGTFGLKFPVSDFERSVAYYTRYFPLKKDKVYNAVEISMASTEPASTQRPLTLWLDRCATAEGRAQMAKASPAGDAVHRKLANCTSAFRAGSGWLFIMVPDAAKIASQLKADGFEANLMRIPATGPGYLLFMTEDPDGNVVEAVQSVE